MTDTPTISDLLAPGLCVVFCGYNPSLTSSVTGNHYAFPGNRFWRVLEAAGITERRYLPSEDTELLAKGIGFTNIVARPTRRADELARDEIREGAALLREKIERYRPAAMAYTGIGVYRWLRGSSRPTWGIQPEPVVPGTVDLVLPSPSGLNRMTFDELVEHYRAVIPFLDQRA